MPKLDSPIPRAIVINIGLKAIKDIPPAMHKPVKINAKKNISRYVITNSIIEKIAFIASFLNSEDSFTSLGII